MKDIILGFVGAGFFIGLVTIFHLFAIIIARFCKKTITFENLDNIENFLLIVQIMTLFTPIAYVLTNLYGVWWVDLLCFVVYYFTFWGLSLFLRERKISEKINIIFTAVVQMAAVMLFLLYFSSSMSLKVMIVLVMGLVIAAVMYTASRVKLYDILANKQLVRGCRYLMNVDEITPRYVEGYIQIENSKIRVRLPKTKEMIDELIKSPKLKVRVKSVNPLKVIFQNAL